METFLTLRAELHTWGESAHPQLAVLVAAPAERAVWADWRSNAPLLPHVLSAAILVDGSPRFVAEGAAFLLDADPRRSEGGIRPGRPFAADDRNPAGEGFLLPEAPAAIAFMIDLPDLSDRELAELSGETRTLAERPASDGVAGWRVRVQCQLGDQPFALELPLHGAEGRVTQAWPDQQVQLALLALLGMPFLLVPLTYLLLSFAPF